MTYYAVQNYGAALQAFALQQSIKRMGAAPELIRYFDKHNESRPHKGEHGVFHILKDRIYRNEVLFHFRRFLRVRRHAVSNSVAFASFRNDYLIISKEPYYDWEDLLQSNSHYNGFVVGSDMVWTPIGQNLDAYFLQFADVGKRFSYAASMTGCAGYTKDDIEKILSYISTFTRISCRENEGVDFIKDRISKDAQLVCDPTLLLDKEDWIKELSLQEYSKSSPYILCYMFGGVPKIVKDDLQRLAHEKKLIIRYVPIFPEELDVEISLGNTGPCGPKEFAELFLNASFIVTNSYHGFLFSLINEKPFLVYHRDNNNKWKANESRISDLLTILGINERYVNIERKIDEGDLKLDYSKINVTLQQLRESSKAYLRSILNDIACQPLKEEVYAYTHVGYLSKKSCTACGACEQICPFHAISMIEGDEGFVYPQVNEDLCRKCNKCVKHCPSINKIYKTMPLETILVVSKDKLREKSASGGAFITIAKYFIDELNGVVFGCILDKYMTCRHAEAVTIEELLPMQNSKYIQSNVGDCYKMAEMRLIEGRHVLFTGTPCQIAGLKTYLSKDYDNLLTVEIICHGVPNQKYWKQYIENLRRAGEVNSYFFRNRANRATYEATFEATFEVKGKTKHIYCLKDPYYGPFVKSESYRPSCYYCQYARMERQSDITIGDCDSNNYYPDFYPLEEKSIILLNTSKSLLTLKELQDKFNTTSLDYKIESMINTPLSHPSYMPLLRDELYKDLEKLSWRKFENKYSEKEKLLRKVFRIPFRLVKRFIH